MRCKGGKIRKTKEATALASVSCFFVLPIADSGSLEVHN